MSRSSAKDISIFDIFIGSGRTIRHNKTPGLPLLQSPYTSQASLIPQETNSKANGSPVRKTNGVAKSPSKHYTSKEDAKAAPKEKFAPDNKQEKPAAGDNPHGFTPAEDAELIDLKKLQGKQGKSWKDIAAQMGRSQAQLKDRWRVINPNGKGGGGNEKKDTPAENKDKSGDEKATSHKADETAASDKAKEKALNDKAKEKAERAKMWKEKAAKENAAKENESNNVKYQANDMAKAKEKAELDHYSKVDAASRMLKYGGGKQGNEVARKHGYKAASILTRTTAATYLDLEEDDLFSFGDITALADIIASDEKLLWQRVAAVFFDRTGRRVLSQDIRDKFGDVRF